MSHAPNDRPTPVVDPSGSLPTDPRLAEALDHYLNERKAGRRPDRESLIRRFPDLSLALAECLDGLDLVEDAAADLPAPEASGLPNSQLGDFQLIRELGRGGMGVVYEARQLSLGRRVALKVLPAAAALDPRLRERFQIEAQAAAHLHHPHIVPVYAVGCDRGVHFYAMQFVDGRPLNAIIRDLKGPAASPPPSDPPTLRARPGSASPQPAPTDSAASQGSASKARRNHFRNVARLGLQAAQALAHAHGLGVVHRDVKPGNLLIDQAGSLWVTDFGLARFLDDPGVTRTNDVIGTLRYMSPEQARARSAIVDHRTDVYSLGATLYELATLRPAFDTDDRRELLRQIATDEPPAPRRIDPTLPRDLETIVLKAMAKEVGDRYASARDLADDLKRYLDDQPIRAKPPGPIGRAVRWSRRHRPLVASVIGALLFVTTATSIVSLIAIRQIRAANATTATKLDEIEKGYLLFSSFDTLSMIAMQGFYVDDPTAVDRNQSFARRVLDSYEAAIPKLADDPQLQVIAHYRAGFTRDLLGLRGGETHYRSAIMIYEDLVEGRDDITDEARETASFAYDALSRLLVEQGRLDDALQLVRESSWATRSMLDRLPGDAKRQFNWVQAQGQLATVHIRRQEKQEAVEALELVWAELDGTKPTTEARRKALATNYELFGRILSRLGDGSGRRRALERVVELRPGVASSQNDLAWALVTSDVARPDDAARAVALAEQAVTAKPDSPAYLNTLGVARFRAGDLSGAAEAIGRSMEAGKGGQALDWLAMALVEHGLGRTDEARAWLDKADSWIDKQPQVDLDTRRFRAEAALALAPPRSATSPAGAAGSMPPPPPVARSAPRPAPTSGAAAQTTP